MCRFALKGNRMSNKKSRRFLKRLARRKDLSYDEAIEQHLGEINKNTQYSLKKKRNKGIKRKRARED